MEYPFVFLRGVSDSNLYMEEVNLVSHNVFKNGFQKCKECDEEGNFIKFCRSGECKHIKTGAEEVSITW